MSDIPATGQWPAPPGAVPADRPTVPGFEILEELGRGGMGVVYKAQQTSLNRLVALKMIRDSVLAGPQDRARFRVETEAAARMRHPNVVQIYEVGEHAGRPYFAMELVEGPRLDEHLAGRPQPPTVAAELVRTLAHAVQHAHAHKVIHRDLKPANVLLGIDVLAGCEDTTAAYPRATDFGQPKIIDFGLAKQLDADRTALTQDGAILGTASYMAPEQAAGAAGKIGPAVDVYALGCILYEMLTGRPPFLADTWEGTLQQVLHEEPLPPSRLQPGVPGDLETVCLKCLEKDPAGRYASATELADDLSRFLQAESVTAAPLDAVERLARMAAREGYEILGVVGRGPRSTVYHARYIPLKQPVALKVFPETACTRTEWENRLHQGADLWAALAHPQIVPVHRTGWLDGSPYLALEYVPQGGLAAKLVGPLFPIRQAVHLVEQLAEIVGYLHRQGAVHGNLKPSNVLLAADGIPRITDFRLTGGLYQGRLPADDQDPAGIAYLTPEFVRDPGAEPRPYTDIYGLGLILYELLTGRPAIAGSTAGDALEHVCSLEPLPPSQLNAEVTPHLDWVCMRCMRKNPWRRFVRAFDVATRLRQFLDDPEGRLVPGQRQRRPGRERAD